MKTLTFNLACIHKLLRHNDSVNGILVNILVGGAGLANLSLLEWRIGGDEEATMLENGPED